MVDNQTQAAPPPPPVLVGLKVLGWKSVLCLARVGNSLTSINFPLCCPLNGALVSLLLPRQWPGLKLAYTVDVYSLVTAGL